MSREVAGEPEGVTLIEAIEAGRIPRPAELTFGRRDGRGLLPHEEVALWREVMAHFYGEERLGSLEEDLPGTTI